MMTLDSMSPAIRDFWARFLAEPDAPEDANSRFFEAFKIGSAEDHADEGAQLILSGTKTATSSLLWDYEETGKRQPAVGDFNIVMNGRDEPVCVVETTWLALQPFALVDEQFARDYGEWDGTLATWRIKCWAIYSEECKALGRRPDQDLPLICERLRVIFAPSDTCASSDQMVSR